MADSDHPERQPRSGLRLFTASTDGAESIALARQTASLLQTEYLGPHRPHPASAATGKRRVGQSLANWDAVMLCGDDGLSIQPLHFASGLIRPSFVRGKTYHRQQFGGGRSQPLARALGIGKIGGSTPISAVSIVDATAGFGRDAWVMATLGCQVTLLEREPWLSLLLRQALEEAVATDSTREIASRMTVVTSPAEIWLAAQDAGIADVVYLDPMYPQHGKKAQAKKEMQLLQSMASTATPPELLLGAALRAARYRVVVKRPASAPLINRESQPINTAPDVSTHHGTRRDPIAPGQVDNAIADSQNSAPPGEAGSARHLVKAGAAARPVGTVSSPNTRYDIYAPMTLPQGPH